MNQERPWQNFSTKYQGGTIRNDHIPPRKHTLNPKQIQALSLEQHFLKMTPCDIHFKSAKFWSAPCSTIVPCLNMFNAFRATNLGLNVAVSVPLRLRKHLLLKSADRTASQIIDRLTSAVPMPATRQLRPSCPRHLLLGHLLPATVPKIGKQTEMVAWSISCILRSWVCLRIYLFLISF